MKRGEKNYSEEEIKAAIEEVKNGQSIRSVAKKYSIVRTTLQRKLKGDVALATRKGPTPIFSLEQESILCAWVKSMSSAGFSITKEILLHSATKFAKESKISFPGKSEGPGRKWLEAFIKRHPDIKMQTGRNFTTSRQKATQGSINNWFDKIHIYIKANKLEDVLLNPSRIFNCGETAFFLNSEVISEKGLKSVNPTIATDEKFKITIHLMGNAAGELIPPMVIYKDETISQRLREAMPPDWAIGKSENGSMQQETINEYIMNVFEPFVKKKAIKTPVILFMNGHSPHLSLELCTFCKIHGIELVGLLSNATNLLHPMDIAVFPSLQTFWKQEAITFQMSNDGDQILIHNFPGVLKLALNHLSPDLLSNGFKTCGLVPWDSNKVIVSSEKKTQKSPIKEDGKFLKSMVEQPGLYYLWLEDNCSHNLQPTSLPNIDAKNKTNSNESFTNSVESLNENSISAQIGMGQHTVKGEEKSDLQDTDNNPIAAQSKEEESRPQVINYRRKKRKLEKSPAGVT